jgi:hypothetical protein
MDKSPIDIAAELARLEALTLFELKGEWRRLHRMGPPKRMSRDLLMRGITFKMQERRLGGLSPSALRKLAPFGAAENAFSQQRIAPPIALKPGSRLVREWRGVTHSVLVLEKGFEWRGERYGSLSTIAREITGAHWSGPRFFGLRKSSSRSLAKVEPADAKD